MRQEHPLVQEGTPGFPGANAWNGGPDSNTKIAGGKDKTVGKVVQLGIQAVKDFFKNKPGRFTRTGSRAALRDLVRAIEHGEDVVADSPSIAKDLARRAGGGRDPVLHKVPVGDVEQGFLPHYHPYGSKSHVFFEPKGGFGIKDLVDFLAPGPTWILPLNQLCPGCGGGDVAAPIK